MVQERPYSLPGTVANVKKTLGSEYESYSVKLGEPLRGNDEFTMRTSIL